MTPGVVLGFDTSCYTTSTAALSPSGEIGADVRRLLTVDEGGIGLRQQAALFQHWNNLPQLLAELFRTVKEPVVALGFSARPRREEGSYLPVFSAGANLARSLAVALKVPAFAFSHQEGHLAAGRLGAGGPRVEQFLAVHLSGGTTELLVVREAQLGFNVKVLGRTLDLNAGQFVDRVGVAMGLPFPAGAALEKVAREWTDKEIETSLPAPVRGYDVSFAGPASAALRQLGAGADKAALARAVFRCIANALEKILRPATEETGIKDILLVGGVASNGFIRKRLAERLEHPAVGARLFFAPPRLSTDNAVGIAHLGQLALGRQSDD